MFDDEVEAARRSLAELEEIMAAADSDPHAFQALLARLETDPNPGNRQSAAWWLLRRADEERCRRALRAAATRADQRALHDSLNPAASRAAMDGSFAADLCSASISR
jgi:hypothetical protein